MQSKKKKPKSYIRKNKFISKVRKNLYWRLLNFPLAEPNETRKIISAREVLNKIDQVGWFEIKDIEKSPCPYNSPESHRRRYLNNDPLIEESNIIHKSVFRLKFDNKTFEKLEEIFGFKLSGTTYYNMMVILNWRYFEEHPVQDLTYLYSQFLKSFFLEERISNLTEEELLENFALFFAGQDKLNKLIKQTSEYKSLSETRLKLRIEEKKKNQRIWTEFVKSELNPEV